MNFSIGSANFGADYGKVSPSKYEFIDPEALLYTAWNNKFRYIDTSSNYLNSEATIGKLSEYNNYPWKVFTKLKYNNILHNSKKIKVFYEDYIKKSLDDLRVEKVYGVLIHDHELAMHDFEFEVALEYLAELKDRGICSKIGVSVYDPIPLISSNKIHLIDIIQAPYNIFDTRAQILQSPELKHIKIEIRSIFLQGALLNSLRKNRGSFFEKWKEVFEKYHNWLEMEKLTPLEACIFFAMMFSPEKIVLGFRDPDEIIQFSNIADSYREILIQDFGASNDLINPYNW